MQKNPPRGGFFCRLRRLEAEAVVLDARVWDGDEPHGLVTGADVGHVDAKLFQAVFQLLDGEIVLV